MMHLQKHATYWRCESDIEVDGAHCAHVWEILDVNVPLDAKPYACLGNVIVFYNAAGQEIGRCRHFDLTVGNHLLFVGGRWWQVGAATVVQRDTRWCVKWHLCGDARLAKEANAGREHDKRAQLAKVN
jgi:hypothetical protein